MFRKNADSVVIGAVCILILLGIAMLASASSDLGKVKFDDPYYFLKHQLLYGLTVGIAGFLAGRFIPLAWWKKSALYLLLGNLLLLVLVFTPLGTRLGGAERWVDIGGLVFQPSEFLKVTFIVYLAAWLSSRTRDRHGDVMEGFLPFLLISGIIGGLLVAQPSTSTVAILMGGALITYFVSGARISYIAGIVLAGIIGLSVIVYITPYRIERVASFLNPNTDPQGSSYHLNQSLIAIGSGGIFGVGYGKSASKLSYLPEPIGDSMFAVIAEELGFVGAVFFIGIFITLVASAFVGSSRVRNQFARLTIVGSASVIATQAFVHMAAVSGLTPLTGVPLPFVSFGGSHLVAFLTMSGLMANALKNA